MVFEARLIQCEFLARFALEPCPVDLQRTGDKNVVALVEADVQSRFNNESRRIREVRIAIAAGNEDYRLHGFAFECRSIAVANKVARAAGARESTSSVIWAAMRFGSCWRRSSRCCS